MTEQAGDETRRKDAGIDVTINGTSRTVPEGSTIGDFLAGRGYRVTMIIVELNGEIVPRETCADIVMRSGDRIEMVHAVGGG